MLNEDFKTKLMLMMGMGPVPGMTLNAKPKPLVPQTPNVQALAEAAQFPDAIGNAAAGSPDLAKAVGAPKSSGIPFGDISNALSGLGMLSKGLSGSGDDMLPSPFAHSRGSDTSAIDAARMQQAQGIMSDLLKRRRARGLNLMG